MAIFSRRSLQRMIDEIARFLSFDQLDSLVKKLNRRKMAPIDSEWEVALLWSFGKLGDVAHEKRMGGYSPDIIFQRSNDEGFVGEVVAVSDKGLEKENPLEHFQQMFWQQQVKRGLTGAGFSFDIGRSPSKDPKRILMLPPKGDLNPVFNDDFHAFLDSVAKSPRNKDSFSIQTDDVDVSITYDPRRGGAGGSYPSYTVAYSLTQNPVYNALKGKKKKLKTLEYTGPKIVFLCDGGCGILRHESTGSDTYGLEQILREFLRQNSSISAVSVLSTHTDTPLWGRGMVARIQMRTYTSPNAHNPLSEDLVNTINQIPKTLPPPVYDAVNAAALYRSREGNAGISHLGGSERGDGYATFSLREISDLLAGTMTQEEFARIHRFEGERMVYPNPFEQWLSQGRMLVEVTIQKAQDEDDDWITFRAGEPDPAISPLANPKATAGNTRGDS